MANASGAATRPAVFKPDLTNSTIATPLVPTFGVSLGSTAGAVAETLGGTSVHLQLSGICNSIFGGDGDVTLRGGGGLSTVSLGNGADRVLLTGGLNTIVLGNGNDYVDAGSARGVVRFNGTNIQVGYNGVLLATLGLPLRPQSGLGFMSGGNGNIGAFNGGVGNVGVFNGWGNSDASDGNHNLGAFNGNDNGGTNNGNSNVGAFNGNLNGIGNSDPSSGNGNGNYNTGALNGNADGNLNLGTNNGNNNGSGNLGALNGVLDGNLNSGTGNGDGNGNANLGALNGNVNGNGVLAIQPASGPPFPSVLMGALDTIVVGYGNDTINALGGLTTIVAGNGHDIFRIGGTHDTVVAGNGADLVNGWNVDHAAVTLGNGSDNVTLLGTGANAVHTGWGNDTIVVTGYGNYVDAGASITMNSIAGGLGSDIFVTASPGQGLDQIYNFTLTNHDVLDLRAALGSTGWDGTSGALGSYLSAAVDCGGNTWVDLSTAAGGCGVAVAELVQTRASLCDLLGNHSLLT